MTAYSGNSFLLKDGTSGTAGTSVAAMRVTSFNFNSGMVDVTTKDSAHWRELLQAGGVRSMSISASGVLTDSVTFDNLLTRVHSGTIMAYGLLFGDSDAIDGSFQITSVSAGGNNDAEQTYDVTLESSGSITLTTA
ncbi:MAG: phage tail tube protein [Hyphomicrobiaceae bacterium]